LNLHETRKVCHRLIDVCQMLSLIVKGLTF
jgi:hypothetical protein